MVKKPERVAAHPVMSAKWDELTEGRDYTAADGPVLALLCYWYAVVDTCERDLQVGDEIQVAYSNDLNDIKALPQVGMLKQASAEIRALNKQLGINDQAAKPKGKAKLFVLQTNRRTKAASAG